MSQIYKASTGGGGSGILTINGDVGSITGPIAFIKGNSGLTQNKGTLSLQAVSATEIDIIPSDILGNTIIGVNTSVPANVTGNDNTGLGNNALSALTTGILNTGIGSGSLKSNQTGSFNTAIGINSLSNLISGTGNVTLGGLGSQISGDYNTAIGFGSGSTSPTTGSRNITIGYFSGNNYTSSESSNILIGNEGTTGDSNVLRIGTQGSGVGQQNKCFAAGINGNTITSPDTVVINSTTGQLGTIVSATQPAFFAYLSTPATNQWGDQTLNVVPYDAIVYDNGTNFNTSTGTFTAPVDGIYQFSATVSLFNGGGVGSSATMLLGAGVTFQLASTAFVANEPNNFLTLNGSCTPVLNAGDTATISITGGTVGLTKTGSYYGAALGIAFTWFSGALVRQL